MSTGKILLYAIAGLVILAVVSVVISAVIAAVTFLWWLARILAMLAVLGAVGYAGYKLYGLVSSGSKSTQASRGGFSMSETGTSSNAGSRSTRDRLEQQYLNGEITEEEFERRLERELNGGEYDSIDRELQRERI